MSAVFLSSECKRALHVFIDVANPHNTSFAPTASDAADSIPTIPLTVIDSPSTAHDRMPEDTPEDTYDDTDPNRSEKLWR